MSSFRAGAIPGMICPACSRSHFPFCSRPHPAMIHPPYAHGRPPLPMHHLPGANLGSPSLLGQPFNRPVSPPRNSLGHLTPLHGRQEGLLEQPSSRAFHGPHHNPILGHPLPSLYEAHVLDRFGASMPPARGHIGRLPIDSRNVPSSWLAAEERERELQRGRELEIQREIQREREMEREREMQMQREREREREIEREMQIQREREIEREIQMRREREILPQWFLDQQRKGLGQQPDRFVGQGPRFDRHPMDLLPPKFLSSESGSNLFHGIGEDHELRRQVDFGNQRDDYQMYQGLNKDYDGIKSRHYGKEGGNYDIMSAVLKGGQQSLAHFDEFNSLHGGFQGLSAPFKHVLGETASQRMDEGADFGKAHMEHNVYAVNRGNELCLGRADEDRDFSGMQSEFLQGARKRSRIEGTEDVQDSKDGMFLGNSMDRGDFCKGQNELNNRRYFIHEGPSHTLSSEYHQSIQSPNPHIRDMENADSYGIDQMKREDAPSKKRQRPVSREEELLLEHGLLEDGTDSEKDGPFVSESHSNQVEDGKALPSNRRQESGLPMLREGNSDGIILAENTTGEKAFAQKSQIAEGKGIYNWNMLERGYSLISEQDILRDRLHMEERQQSRDMPSHLHGRKNDSMQGQSVNSEQSVWQSKVDDLRARNEGLTASQAKGTFLVTGDSSHMLSQHLTGALALPSGDKTGLPESSISKARRFEEHQISNMRVMEKFSQLKPQSRRDREHGEPLKTIEELHLDFMHQQQEKMHNQPQFRSGHFREEFIRSDAHDSLRDQQELQQNFLPQVHQQQQHAVAQNQIELPRQDSQPFSQSQVTHTQIQQFQPTQLGEQSHIHEKIENKIRGSQPLPDSYEGRLYHSNIQPHHQWAQSFQHANSRTDMSLQKNSNCPPDASTHVHNHEQFWHPPPDHRAQNQHLQHHDQHQQEQQRPHQHEQQISKLHQDSSRMQLRESHLISDQAPQNVPPIQHQQNLQPQQGTSQPHQDRFQQHLPLQGEQYHQGHQLIHEKQNTQEWTYHLQQQINQEGGQQYPLEAKAPPPQQFNQKINPPMQQQWQILQYPQQQTDAYQQLHRHHQQPQVQHDQLQAQQKSQHMPMAGCPEIPQAHTQGSYQLMPNGDGALPGKQMQETMTGGQSQLSQSSNVLPSVPLRSAPAPAPPPSPPSSPPHAPPPPPPPPSSPLKSSASASFSSAAGGTHSLPTAMRSFPEIQPSANGYQYKHPPVHHGTGFASAGSQFMQHMPFKQYGDQGKHFPPKQAQEDRPKVVDAVNIFRQPGRATRPDRFVVILRGLPGSGKSYLAKALRDVEVTNGGSAPRIHSMDDYFMTEVEKVEDGETGNVSSSMLRGKKRITKKVMEYCYEPEMEEAYRASMLKAFKKTLEEGIFTFIIEIGL
eukprot:Gb_23470 [translate_table: standard]